MKPFIDKAIAVLFLALLFSGNAYSETFTGFVTQAHAGVSASPSFTGALIGFSNTPDGFVTLYRLTSDTTYYDSLMKSLIDKSPVRITHSNGTITGLYYQ